MRKSQHSIEFVEQALSKARMRGTRTLAAVATELDMSLGTLKGWLKRSGPLVSAASRLLPDRWMLPGGKE